MGRPRTKTESVNLPGPVRGKVGGHRFTVNTPASPVDIAQRTQCQCIGRRQFSPDEDGDLSCVRCGKTAREES